MISIAMFNNKGGVGKTTLTCNIASYFSREMKFRVLVVDCDPQCNATQLIMGEEFATNFYLNNNEHDSITTIRDVLSPIGDGDAHISSVLQPILGSRNRFGVDVLPGHPGLSIIEDRLGAAWHDLLGGDIGGIRKTNWNTALGAALRGRYDIVLYDLGPSLGSINRCVLIGCDHFLTPMGADIFSILGIKNIANWIRHWLELYRNSLALCEQRNPHRLQEYLIAQDPGIAQGYLGYTMQQYIAKSKEGQRIPTARYENIIKLVPAVIGESLHDYLKPGLTPEDAHLGDVPHLYSLIPLAQSVAAPILALKSSDGLVGSQYRQRDDYENIIGSVSQHIAANIGLQAGA
ncbi:ParA family protein [Bordetella bronchiseptica]|uniref:ParA family protein n=1 Tax=Bordetella bronchiseptica TaxID=518 RepID=UPI0009BF6650|nr:ParA family protein [Bordetella bronchiseptica]